MARALKEALDELVSSISIATSAKEILDTERPGIHAMLNCACSNSARSPTRQISKANPTLLACVQSLRELIETKHADCIAAKLAEDEAAAAAAARKQNLGCLGTMMDAAKEAAVKKGAAKRRTAELEAAKELRNTTTLAAAEAEALAESARRDEAEHAAPYVAKRNAAEEEAVVAKRALVQAMAALAELHGDEKRARSEGGVDEGEGEDDADPPAPPHKWGISTFLTQEAWAARRRAVPVERHCLLSGSGSPSPCSKGWLDFDDFAQKGEKIAPAARLWDHQIQLLKNHFAGSHGTPDRGASLATAARSSPCCRRRPGGRGRRARARVRGARRAAPGSHPPGSQTPKIRSRRGGGGRGPRAPHCSRLS